MPQLQKQKQLSPFDEQTSFHFFYTEFEEHTHDYYEIMIITQGKATHIINEINHPTEKHDAWLVFPSDRHSLSIDTTCYHLNIVITAEALKLFCNSIDQTFYSSLKSAKNPIKIKLSEDSYNHIISLIHKYQSLPMDEINRKNGILNCVTLHLIESFYINFSTSTKTIPKWLNEFLEQLSTAESLSKKPNEIYEMVNYSYSNFERLFKRYMGVSFLTHFNSLKINYAKELLKNTELSIIDISNKLGIASLSHFYHMFKKENNVSPSLYRKKFSKKNV